MKEMFTKQTYDGPEDKSCPHCGSEDSVATYPTWELYTKNYVATIPGNSYCADCKRVVESHQVISVSDESCIVESELVLSASVSDKSCEVIQLRWTPYVNRTPYVK